MAEETLPSNVNPQLSEHLKGFASKGIALEKAKEALKATGWSDEEINAALLINPYDSPQQAQTNLSQSNYSATMPSYPDSPEQHQTNHFASISLLASILLLGTFIVYALFHYSLSPAPQTSGTISTSDCLKENGTIADAANKVCQLGSVQLTIVDN